jgi:ParB family chromosome partitioning protein
MGDRKLGRGLDFLIQKTQEIEADEAVSREEGASIPMGQITTNPHQPRRVFDVEQLNDLIESIRFHGVIQPITVRAKNGGYEIIAGERRWRASQELGLETIPAVVHEADDQQMLEWALIENVQRVDLDPIEKGVAYRELIQHFKVTQEDAARRLGLKRSTVSNAIRLLDLEDAIQLQVSEGALSMGQARTLLSFPESERKKMAEKAAHGGLSVRALEKLATITRGDDTTSTPAPRETKMVSPHLVAVQDRLRRALGTKVSVSGDHSRGRVSIEYYSTDDLNRLLDVVEEQLRPSEAAAAQQ